MTDSSTHQCRGVKRRRRSITSLQHLDQLYATLDTQHIVLNLIAEKLNVTKGELQAYVEKKRQELEVAAKLNEAAQKLAKDQEAAGEQSNR